MLEGRHDSNLNLAPTSILSLGVDTTAMRTVSAVSVLGFAAQALAHGYVYRITADNTV